MDSIVSQEALIALSRMLTRSVLSIVFVDYYYTKQNFILRKDSLQAINIWY